MMIESIDWRSLEHEIKTLESEYLDCINCSLKRLCCNAQQNYTIDFTENEAKSIFGKKLNSYLNKKKLRICNDSYKLTNCICPKYQHSKCTIHSSKKRLGLNTCLNFPFRILREGFSQIEMYKDKPLLLVQYRCFSIEREWESLIKEFTDIKRKYSIEVYIVYNESDSTWGVLLRDFELIRKINGIEPQQMFNSFG